MQRFIFNVSVVLVVVIILNVFYELLFLCFPIGFSRIGAMDDLSKNIQRKNITNMTSVMPDELVGEWLIEFSDSTIINTRFRSNEAKILLRDDQSFLIEYPKSAVSFETSQLPPNIPCNRKSLTTQEDRLQLKGNWGIMTTKADTVGVTQELYRTYVTGRYENEDKYVILGEILDNHASFPKRYILIKWRLEAKDLGSDPGIYFKKLSLYSAITKSTNER